MRDEIVVVDEALAGTHCIFCDEPVQLGQKVHINGDTTGDDGSRVVVYVLHEQCPVVESAA